MTSAEIISLLGIVLGLALVMYLSYKGWSPLLVAPLAGIIIFAFSGLNPATYMISDFMPKVANQVKGMGALYMCSFMFAKVMNDTHSTHAIGAFMAKTIGAKHAPTIVILFSMILRLGGLNIGSYLISYAIGVYLYSKADYYEHTLLAVILGGTWTFSNAMPFFPSNHNVACMNQMGTTSTAGLIPGMVAGIFELIAICLFCEWLVRHLQKKGVHFGAHDFVDESVMDESTYPNIIIAAAPLIIFVLVYNLLSVNVAVAMLAGAIATVVLNFKFHSFKDWMLLWQTAAKECLGPLGNLCILSGLGAAVVAAPFYGVILNIMTESSIHPYILVFLATFLVGGLIGSAVTAINTVMPAFLPLMEMWCSTMGLDMGVFHRIMVFGSLPSSTLPHNGALAVMCDMFHTTQKQSFGYAIVTGFVIPFIAGMIAVALGMMGML